MSSVKNIGLGGQNRIFSDPFLLEKIVVNERKAFVAPDDLFSLHLRLGQTIPGLHAFISRFTWFSHNITLVLNLKLGVNIDI